MTGGHDTGEDNTRGLMRSIMRGSGRFMPSTEDGENKQAVRMMRILDAVRDVLSVGPLRRSMRRIEGKQQWPMATGAYSVGDATAPVAICTLTSNDLMQPLALLPGVAIAGRVYTPNLGIEKIILNVTSNPSIRFFLLCGKESPVFHPGQAIRALMEDGVTSERRIIGAQGHLPVLSNISMTRIAAFRQQIELIDHTGETNIDEIATHVEALAQRNPGPFSAQSLPDEDLPRQISSNGADTASFTPIRPGGQRQPLVYDPRGFFVITLDRKKGEILLRHYLPDNTPMHEMRGRSADPMLLGLIRENLLSQLSHAGYLGAELAKAEVALRLGLRYEQDQPVRTQPEASSA